MKKKLLFIVGAVVCGALMGSPHSFAFPVVKDANGEVVGGFLGYVAPSAPQMQDDDGISDFLMITQTGYMFTLSYTWSSQVVVWSSLSAVIRKHNNYVSEYLYIFYESPDCSGQGYVQSVQSGIITAIQEQRDLEEGVTLSEPSLFYVPKGAAPVKMTFKSFLYVPVGEPSSTCGPISYIEKWVVPIFPNDPTVTGVTEQRFPLPIYFDFDYRFGSPEIFYDRFKVEQ